MSMEALNQLVARSIIDPTILKAFAAGHIDGLLAELQFSPELRRRLSALQADSFAEFSLLAYRMVRATQETQPRIELPSPLEGLVEDSERSGREQIA